MKRMIVLGCIALLASGCVSTAPEHAPFYGAKTFTDLTLREPETDKERTEATGCRERANDRYPRGGDEIAFAVMGGVLFPIGLILPIVGAPTTHMRENATANCLRSLGYGAGTSR